MSTLGFNQPPPFGFGAPQHSESNQPQSFRFGAPQHSESNQPQSFRLPHQMGMNQGMGALNMGMGMGGMGMSIGGMNQSMCGIGMGMNDSEGEHSDINSKLSQCKVKIYIHKG